ncbi:MAG: putative lipid II flippase FtsW [Actinobacteria bacterium]|uniref:peptidoglycan glycosyltransferase n=1 Tax=freshwater metagenome TaxID=449393 RepID=A0A6J7HAS3_9ZZZZ|nr:putative lipid II flippase FtsW [Actinomycetota bacterium]MSX24617.1 putative lipid II flippase FtsW [Actinomycetota bacterium]MSY46631.1 putative lipid II flippase FtsW [Actinomycetota bacterium]MSY57690.1 putative lipid II flippase FtsW [Actinomycetota bacterium]MTA99956.1 putative lipid II flippase FtsW [Actinomycetota bacterium]
MKKQNFITRPISAYYLLLASTAGLTGLGIIMVLSASSIHSLETNGSSFAIFFKQLFFLSIALPLGYVASRLPLIRWRNLAKFALIITVAILFIVQIPRVGQNVGGNVNWIGVGPFTIQPSEFGKFLMCLWAGYMIANRENSRTSQKNLMLLISPGFAGVALLILKGRDLGTTCVYAAIFVGVLFIAGISMRFIAATSAGAVAAVLGLILTAPARADRLKAVFKPFAPEYYKLAGWQPAHSIMGLASGGFFGVGLGASRQKWGNLAEAHTDFIISVIGEELGLLGTLTVIVLLGILIISIFRIALRAQDTMVRYTCAGIGCAIAAQSILNIGTATSVLPVVGVTLPLLSYGGSSLIATYLSLGFVLGAARRDPEIASVLKKDKP